MVSNGLQLGIVMEMLVFALALSRRIRLIQAQQLALQQKAGWLAKAAQTDAMTGLANRAGLEARAAQMLAESGLHSVMLLDLDGFKAVNDRHGHRAGDQVLIEVARRIKAALRGADTAARLGGDEFVVLVAGAADAVDRPRLGELAMRLQTAIRAEVAIDGGAVQVGSSLGIALCPADGQTLPALLASADQAMYQAKEAGRGDSVFFEDSRFLGCDQTSQRSSKLPQARIKQAYPSQVWPGFWSRMGLTTPPLAQTAPGPRRCPAPAFPWPAAGAI
jgi:diguanylate cyclase (GGDEF)-like protein